jgi:hypothetical protein
MPDGKRCYDLTLVRFGMLKAIRYCGLERRGHSRWLCNCTCGIILMMDGTTLTGSKPNDREGLHCSQHPGAGRLTGTPMQEEEMRELHVDGIPDERIAQLYGIPVRHVSNILHRRAFPMPSTDPHGPIPDRAAQWLLRNGGFLPGNAPWSFWLGDHRLMQSLSEDEDVSLVQLCKRRGMELFWISDIIPDENGIEWPVLTLREEYRGAPVGERDVMLEEGMRNTFLDEHIPHLNGYRGAIQSYLF